MKDTTISLKVDRALKAKLIALAEKENRSLSNYIEKLIKENIAQQEAKHARGKA